MPLLQVMQSVVREQEPEEKEDGSELFTDPRGPYRRGG